MAATQSKQRFVKYNANEIIIAVRLSAMTSDLVENVSYAESVDTRFPKRKPCRVSYTIVTPPTARGLLALAVDPEAAVATSSTVCYVPVRAYGSDLAGAVIDVELHFDGSSDGGGYVIP